MLFFIIAGPLGLASLVIGISHVKADENLLNQIRRITHEVAHGKLENRLVGLDERSSFRDAALSINETLDQMEMFIREVKTVFAYSREGKFFRKTFHTGLLGEFSDGLKQIDISIRNMEQDYWSKFKEELEANLGQLKTNRLLANLRSSQKDLQQMSVEMSKVEESTAEVANTAQESRVSVESVLKNLNQLIVSTDALRSSSESLGKNSKEITEVVTFIANVADQTNLLALNAAIEAAEANSQEVIRLVNELIEQGAA